MLGTNTNLITTWFEHDVGCDDNLEHFVLLIVLMMLVTAQLKWRRTEKMKLQATLPTTSVPSGLKKSAKYRGRK